MKKQDAYEKAMTKHGSPIKRAKKKAVRKPRDFDIGFITACVEVNDDESFICLGFDDVNSKQSRKLAAWLLKAANYLDSKK